MHNLNSKYFIEMKVIKREVLILLKAIMPSFDLVVHNLSSWIVGFLLPYEFILGSSQVMNHKDHEP